MKIQLKLWFKKIFIYAKKVFACPKHNLKNSFHISQTVAFWEKKKKPYPYVWNLWMETIKEGGEKRRMEDDYNILNLFSSTLLHPPVISVCAKDTIPYI